MTTTAIRVPGWPVPKGFENGVVAEGRVLFVAGQIGGTPRDDGSYVFEKKDLAGQFGQALANVLAVVRAAGGDVSDVVRLTVYVTNVADYRASLREVGRAYREHMGKHFPAMALVGVTELVEREAVVEIEATAVLPSPLEPGQTP